MYQLNQLYKISTRRRLQELSTQANPYLLDRAVANVLSSLSVQMFLALLYKVTTTLQLSFK